MEQITRRQSLQKLGAGALALGCASVVANAESSVPKLVPSAGPLLQYKNGEFKIFVICDLHYNFEKDEESLAMIGRWLDSEKPNLVIADGDLTTMDREKTTEDQVKTVIGWIGQNMEQRGIPWGITFGNHDPEHSIASGMTKQRMIEFYATFPHNINKHPAHGLSGAGNQLSLIHDSRGTKPVHALWLLDSGDSMSGKHYQMHADQIKWYYEESKMLEQKHNSKIPGIMFFHIPIPEYAELAQTKKFIGAHGETECVPDINAGLLCSILDRGDIKIICTGHDHVNNYIGNWHGVHLSYAGVAGFHAYPHTPANDPSNDKCRCGRVFLFNEAEPGSFKSWIRFKDNTLREDGPQPDASIKPA